MEDSAWRRLFFLGAFLLLLSCAAIPKGMVFWLLHRKMMWVAQHGLLELNNTAVSYLQGLLMILNDDWWVMLVGVCRKAQGAHAWGALWQDESSCSCGICICCMITLNLAAGFLSLKLSQMLFGHCVAVFSLMVVRESCGRLLGASCCFMVMLILCLSECVLTITDTGWESLAGLYSGWHFVAVLELF